MTKALRSNIATFSIAALIALRLVSSLRAGAQNPSQTPPPAPAMTMMAAPQTTPADQQNFPP
ncbi:MAG: hypothetical protein WA654_17505, partial [Candidatus Sulfotelmatobacter sp.]